MNNIIYIRYLPLTKKVCDDFYMGELADEGYHVEYWDITQLFFPGLEGVESYIPTKEEGVIVSYIKEKKELCSKIKESTDALYISIMSFDWRLVFLFRMFTRFHCKTACFAYLAMPLPVASYSTRIKNIKRRVKNLRDLYSSLGTKFFLPICLKTGYVKLYDYCFKAGKNGWKVIGAVGQKDLHQTKFYDINNLDYDKLITSNIKIESQNYIVFLDEYLPFHPDGLMFYGHSINPDVYYESLNKLFGQIESYYKMPVVIAAHPKALKYEEKNYYNGRKVVFNSTLECVAKSSMVLAHNSSSIGFAIMCNKRVIFIDTLEIKKELPGISEETIRFSEYFKSPLISADELLVDKLPENTEIPAEVLEIYNNLKFDYLTSAQSSIPNINLLKSYLRQIFEKG